MEKLHYDEEQIWHDTELLLKKYRQVRWALEVSAHRASDELHRKCSAVDRFLCDAQRTGIHIRHMELESRAQSLDCSRMMLDLIDRAAEFMRTHHEKGELLYQILNLSYFTKHPTSQDVILEQLSENGLVICRNSLFRYRKEGIAVMGEILWGYNDKESTDILSQFSSISEKEGCDILGTRSYQTDSH